MILRQFLHTEPVAISYLFGCGGKAAAAVVDPVGDIEPYLKTARETGTRILYVIDTHIHADHISAGRRLAEAAGADYVLFAEANAASPFHGARDGDVLSLGNVSVHRDHLGDRTLDRIQDLREGLLPRHVGAGGVSRRGSECDEGEGRSHGERTASTVEQHHGSPAGVRT